MVFTPRNKKGLSDVITTVLIILLVLAAVVLIWGFIRTQLNKSTDTINYRSKCLSLMPEVTACTNTSTPSAVSYNVAYRTGGEAPSAGLKVVMRKADGTTTTTPVATVNAVGSQAISITAPQTDGQYYASIFGSITKTDGTVFTCDPSAEVTCTSG